jgi:hypothetical protein
LRKELFRFAAEQSARLAIDNDCFGHRTEHRIEIF